MEPERGSHRSFRDFHHSPNEENQVSLLRIYFSHPESDSQGVTNGVFQTLFFRVGCSEGGQDPQGQKAQKCSKTLVLSGIRCASERGFPLSKAEVRHLKNTVWKTPFRTLRDSGFAKQVSQTVSPWLLMTENETTEQNGKSGRKREKNRKKRKIGKKWKNTEKIGTQKNKNREKTEMNKKRKETEKNGKERKETERNRKKKTERNGKERKETEQTQENGQKTEEHGRKRKRKTSKATPFRRPLLRNPDR